MEHFEALREGPVCKNLWIEFSLIAVTWNSFVVVVNDRTIFSIQIIDCISVSDKLELHLEKLTLQHYLEVSRQKWFAGTSSIFLSHTMLQETFRIENII